MRRLILFATALMLTACGGEEAQAPAVDDPCPEISAEGYANDWIKVAGKTANHTYRIRIFEDGGAWKAWYVGGFFTKLRMKGVVRTNDLQLTEVPDERGAARYASGEKNLARLYFSPNKSKCAMRVMEVKVSESGGKEVEKQVGSYIEYLKFPEGGPEFTYRPADEALFLGAAAKKLQVAQKELDTLGQPNPGVPFGEAVPVGMWSDADADGDAACTYDFDLYFDDRIVEDKQKLPAGAVSSGKRHWQVDAYAPYSGNHHFELYRYRTCGGERALIAVAGNVAVLG